MFTILVTLPAEVERTFSKVERTLTSQRSCCELGHWPTPSGPWRHLGRPAVAERASLCELVGFIDCEASGRTLR